MGLYKISLYDRGWFEWSSIANSTIQTGANGAYKSTTVINELMFNRSLTTTTTQTTTVKINEIPIINSINDKPFVTETTKQQQISIQTTKPIRPSYKPTTDLSYKNQFDLVSKNNAGLIRLFNFYNKILIFIVSIFIIF